MHLLHLPERLQRAEVTDSFDGALLLPTHFEEVPGHRGA